MQTLTTNSTLVFTFMAPVMSDEHWSGSDSAATVLPRADNGVLMNFHVGVQLFPIIELFNAFFALKCKSMRNKMCQNIALGFVALLTYLHLIRVSVLDVRPTGTYIQKRVEIIPSSEKLLNKSFTGSSGWYSTIWTVVLMGFGLQMMNVWLFHTKECMTGFAFIITGFCSMKMTRSREFIDVLVSNQMIDQIFVRSEV